MNKTALLFGAALLLAVTAATASAQVLTTDKGDYEPGETVQFVGGGFEPGETVDLLAAGNTNGTRVTHQAVADQDGSIRGSFVIPLIWEEMYVLTATGATSGVVAETSFLDGYSIFRVTPPEDNVTLTCGQSFTFTVRAGTQQSPVLGATIYWSATGGSPASWTSPATAANGLASYAHTAGSTHGQTYVVKAWVNVTGGGQHERLWNVTTSCPPSCTAPTVSAPGNASYQCASQVPAGSVGDASASGPCNPVMALEESTNSGLGSASSPLVITRTYTATNDVGQTGSAVQSITVIDDTPPVIALTGASEMTVECGSAFSDPGATASDACAGNLGAAGASGSVNTSVVGSYTITYSASDGNGNSASATRTVIVQDLTAPTFTSVPAGPTLAANGSCQAAIPNLAAAAAASDNCGGVSISQSLAAGSMVGLGSHAVTLTATDAAGNSKQEVVNVTVADQAAPVVTAPPALVVPICSYSPALVTGGSAMDNCDGALTPTASNVPNGSSPGSSTVTWSATDGAGNTGSASQTVTINYGTLNGFLSPMPGGTAALEVRRGRTVPIKFKLSSCPGYGMAVADISVTMMPSNATETETPQEALSTTGADAGTRFRYSASDDQYIFNLKVDYTVNKTYRIRATFAGGQTLDGYIKVTK